LGDPLPPPQGFPPRRVPALTAPARLHFRAPPEGPCHAKVRRSRSVHRHPFSHHDRQLDWSAVCRLGVLLFRRQGQGRAAAWAEGVYGKFVHALMDASGIITDGAKTRESGMALTLLIMPWLAATDHQ